MIVCHSCMLCFMADVAAVKCLCSLTSLVFCITYRIPCFHIRCVGHRGYVVWACLLHSNVCKVWQLHDNPNLMRFRPFPWVCHWCKLPYVYIYLFLLRVLRLITCMYYQRNHTEIEIVLIQVIHVVIVCMRFSILSWDSAIRQGGVVWLFSTRLTVKRRV